MRKSIYVLVVGLVTTGLLLAACARPEQTPTPTTPSPTGTGTPTPKASPTPTPTPTGAPQYGGILRVASQNAPRSLIPEINTIKNWFMQPTYDTLLRLDEKGDLGPNLATDWKLSADNKSLTLTLRKGVKFHNGTDFNAEAVKWAIQTKQAAKLGDYPGVESVDVIDDYTVRLNLSVFQNTLFSSLWYLAGLMHSPTAYQKDGRDRAQFNPVGTGPFKFVRYDSSALVKWERFDGYWQKGKPYLDGFEQLIIADPTTRELALRKGEIHAAEALTAKVVSQLEEEGWPIIKAPAETYNVFVPDSANADSPFANKKVREAVEHAIDRAAVAKALGYGLQEGLTQMTPSGTYAYVPDIKGREYNPVKAKQLRAEAGYPYGFKTTLLTRDTLAEALVAAQGFLREVGIEATVDVADAGRFVTLTQQGWKNMLVYRAFRVPPDWLQFAYTYVSPKTLESKSMLRPAGFEDLLQTALLAPDMASKKTASQAVIKTIYDEAMVVPLWASLSTLPYAKNVNNIGYYVPWGQNKLWGPSDVWLSK
ncbi:MAG: hypothetical protein HY667_06995 [Chloroflexi bacterium]|nr:hypothetical protein [Chloroflexota bacterium]